MQEKVKDEIAGKVSVKMKPEEVNWTEAVVLACAAPLKKQRELYAGRT